MRGSVLRVLLGCGLILLGSLLAWRIQTAGGVRVEDVRFNGADGTTRSALLYRPANATAATPAPGVLAVHGYINTRETQSGFAIEFARRGYVVLVLDQTGHGGSGGAAFSSGFGGPDGLRYLRSLPYVDTDNIGLEGHSMGGWTVLAAAGALPDAYKAMVLQGSSTGPPFAAPGTPRWPRNLALVFSRYDEFSKTMWGVDRARDVGESPKLRALFGTAAPVEEGRLYGSIPRGTARILHVPPVTHPGDHISHRAIGHSLDWFARTLEGGAPRPSSDQVWLWKEIGTLVALIGFVVLLLGVFEGLLGLPVFRDLRRSPPEPEHARRDRRWWTALLVGAFLPVLIYFPAFLLGAVVFRASAWAPQSITNQIVVWGVCVALLTALLDLRNRRRTPGPPAAWGRSALLALATAAAGYAVLLLVDALLKVDFRFWVLGLRPLTADQAQSALVYVWPITGFLLVILTALQRRTPVAGEGRLAAYAAAVAAMAGGFAVLLKLDYAALFLDGRLLTWFDPLNTIVAIQFVPLLAFVAVVSTFTYRRTGSAVPGALLCGLVVTWYVVAGTATHVV